MQRIACFVASLALAVSAVAGGPVPRFVEEIIQSRGDATVVDGVLIRVDVGVEVEILLPGQEIGGGSWWAPFGGAYEVDGCVVDFGHAWVMHTNQDGEVGLAAGGVSVTCASGFYACCLCNGCPVARCRRNDRSDNDCQAGGQGSQSCSIDRHSCP